jgi:hypothetical protein
MSAVVLGSPCARMNPWVEQRAVRPRVRARLQRVRELCHAFNGTALNLTSTMRMVPKRNNIVDRAGP